MKLRRTAVFPLRLLNNRKQVNCAFLTLNTCKRGKSHPPPHIPPGREGLGFACVRWPLQVLCINTYKLHRKSFVTHVWEHLHKTFPRGLGRPSNNLCYFVTHLVTVLMCSDVWWISSPAAHGPFYFFNIKRCLCSKQGLPPLRRQVV